MILEEKIFACIVSIAEREHTLIDTINSILPYVDKVYLFLNNYSNSVADKLKSISYERIEYVIGDNSTGDAGKFYWANKLKGYILTLDDDIVFPSDYVKILVSGIEKYQRKAIVTFHGRILNFPMISYHKQYAEYTSFSNSLENDIFIHVAGTGCMGWHSDTMSITMSDFPSANMADIHVSILCQKKKVPIVALAHNGNWIKGSYYPPNSSLSGAMAKNDKEHTDRVNSVTWKLYVIMWSKSIANNVLMNFDIAYVINLCHRTDRYANIFNECIKNNISPVRIDAVNGKQEFSHLQESKLLMAHYGCAMSHIKTLEYVLDNGSQCHFIMEDDCKLDDNFNDKLSEYSKQLPNDWDLLYLGGSLINASIYDGGNLINNGASENFSQNLLSAKNVLTTHAYIIKNDSIRKLLSVIKSRKDRIDILFQEFQKQANCFIVYPELAWQKAGYSDIVSKVTNNIHLRYGVKLSL